MTELDVCERYRHAALELLDANAKYYHRMCVSEKQKEQESEGRRNLDLILIRLLRTCCEVFVLAKTLFLDELILKCSDLSEYTVCMRHGLVCVDTLINGLKREYTREKDRLPPNQFFRVDEDKWTPIMAAVHIVLCKDAATALLP